MADQKTILDRMIQLSDAARTAPLTEAAFGSKISAVSDSRRNVIELEDGIVSISFETDAPDSAFLIGPRFGASNISIKNLATGEIETAPIDPFPIPDSSTHTVKFENSGVTIVVNADFFPAGNVNTSGSVYFQFLPNIIQSKGNAKLISMSPHATQDLVTTIIDINTSDSSSSSFTIGDFSSLNSVDLSIVGNKLVELSNGQDSFKISINIQDPLSDGDTAFVDLRELGSIFFSNGQSVEIPTDIEPRAIIESDNQSAPNSMPASINRLESEDGFASITFDRNVDEQSFQVTYDVASRLMTMTSILTGMTQSRLIDGEAPIQIGETQSVNFGTHGAVVTLNDAFDLDTPIEVTGGIYSATLAGGSIVGSSIEISNRSLGVPDDIFNNLLRIDATAANAAELSIAGFSGNDTLDLTARGLQTATLTDGAETFDISFMVDTAFSNSDAGDIHFDRIGALVFNQRVGPLEISGSRNADTLNGDVLDDVIFGDDGDDVMTGGAGSDLMHGGGGADRIDGGDDDDLLIGFWGDDVIIGGAGRDRIFGNSGDDILTGGTGNDRLTGQFGADTFVHAPGDNNDGVTDFDPTEDLIDLTAHNFANFAAVQALMSQIASGTLIDLAGPDSVLLEGVAIGAVGEAHFLL